LKSSLSSGRRGRVVKVIVMCRQPSLLRMDDNPALGRRQALLVKTDLVTADDVFDGADCARDNDATMLY
jgi:hypothetical protein